MKKLSIIIPVYNNEKDIKKLLDILLVQKNENVEIVCINDGSTDDSQKILEQYADETFVRVFNQENGGGEFGKKFRSYSSKRRIHYVY